MATIASTSRSPAGRLVELAAVVIAAIIVLHIIFVLIGANGSNEIVSTDSDWANTLAVWFRDMFTLSSAKLEVLVNFGLAALFYLAIGRIVASIVNSI
jgi:hypothetical protein